MRGLLKAYGINRVYVLGAGFSAPLGLPLTSRLLQLVHEVAATKPWFGDGGKPFPNGQADWLLEELQWYFPTERIDHAGIARGELPQGFDIERFLSYVAATSAFQFKTGERWNEHGDKFTAFLKTWLAEVIVNHQVRATHSIPTYYREFARSLPGSLVLTFNWDTVLESILDQERIAFTFDLPSAYQNGKVPIIKLHGSIDWFSKPSAEQTRPWMRFDHLSKSFEGCYRAQGNPLRYYEQFLTPWIVMPSYDKVSQILALGDLWQLPWIYLQDELQVSVIGFSMRSDDFHSRAFLYPQFVQGTRDRSLTVKVVDLAADDSQRHMVAQRFHGVENCQFHYSGFSSDALRFLAAS